MFGKNTLETEKCKENMLKEGDLAKKDAVFCRTETVEMVMANLVLEL